MKFKPKILVLGKNGQIGHELARAMASLGEVVALDRNGLDLADVESIPDAIRDIAPDIILNAAAYTAVDKAESEPELANLINAVAPGILAQEAKNIGALLVHYSTDYVFDGQKTSAYRESDETGPINVYGKTKLAGEQAIKRNGGDYLIFRTSWVYGSRGSNFLLTMLRLMRENNTLRVVDDQIGAPTWARSIAEATAKIIKQSCLERDHRPFASGLFHMTSNGETSWHGFAREIARLQRKYNPAQELRVKEIIPVGTSAYPTPARRPTNSRLDVTLLQQKFGAAMPEWEQALEECIAEMNEARETSKSK